MIFGGLEILAFKLIAGSLAVGAVVVVTVAIFAAVIASWVVEQYEKLPTKLKDDIEGIKTFLAQKSSDAIQEIAEFFSYDKKTEQWSKTTSTQEISASEVPPEFLVELKKKSKLDITPHLNELQLKV